MPCPAPRAGALFANARDDQPVASDAEAMFAGHFVAQFDELLVLEFEQPVALRAVEMVVLRVAVVVFIDGSTVEDELAKEPRIDEFPQRPIDGRPADVPLAAAGGKLFHELVGVEMLVPRENVIHQGQPLLRHPHAAALQVFHEPIAGSGRDGNTA